MNKRQGVLGNVGVLLRKCRGLLRTLGGVLVMGWALSAQAQSTSLTLDVCCAIVGAIPYGQTATFTATVNGADPMTGTVTVMDGTTTLFTAPVTSTNNGGVYVATFSTSTLSVGNHSFQASYSGDTYHDPSYTAMSLQVNKDTSATALVSNAQPSTFGQGLTLTATVVSAGTGFFQAGKGLPPSGAVTFKDGATTLGTGTLNAGVATLAISSLSPGNHSLTAVYAGDANFVGSTSSTLTQGVNQASTTTALSSSANPSAYGQSVTLMASVTGQYASGTVTFKDGATVLGTGTLSNGVATFSTSTLNVAGHSLTAVYGGDANYTGSTSSAVTQAVNQASTATALSSSANPSAYGQGIALTATVSGQSPTGTVTFKDGVTALGTGTLSNGVATFSTSALSMGSHSITAVYGGDGNNAGSASSAVVQTVNQASTTTVVASNANPSAYGQGVTLTASVAGQSPSGTVTFKDGAATLGTGTLSNGVATMSTSTLSLGNHNITAIYGGDTNNVTSTSSAVTQVVNRASTTTALSSSANPSAYGQSTTLTASVTGQSPSGTVTFMEGATTLGTGTLSNGVGTFSTSTLSVGSHNITAVYGGDTNNAGSASSALAQVVNRATTSTALASSANPSSFGQGITLSASVAGQSPSGTVTFMDGAATLGTGTLSNGVATFNTGTLSVASHSLTAVYAGDSNNAGSTSSAVAQTVNQASTTTVVASNASPSAYGQSVTLTASVTGQSPSGTVTFKDGTTTLGTGALSNGVGTFGTSALSVGSHNITAVYGGDANNTGSASGAVTQVVNQASSSTSLSSSANPSSYGQSVTLTAAISGQSPTGTVTFKDGATILGSGTLAGGVATLSVSTLSVATHNLTAEYSGDSNNAASTSSALAQVVNVGTTTSTVASSLNPSTYNSGITFTATVTGSAPTGTVTFLDGAVSLGTGTLSGSGNSLTATLAVSTLAVGSHSISVSYAGDANNGGSTSGVLTQTVNKASPTISVASSLNPSNYAANVTFTATVNGQAPTGTVTFMDGATSLGSGALTGTGNSRTATLTINTLSASSHSITAVYSGDGNNNTITSGALSQTVNKVNLSGLALTSSANPSAYSQNITLTATLSGGVSPTGTVSFKDGSTTLATVSLVGNVASYSISTLSVATHGLQAAYNGDANNNIYGSSVLSQVVNKYASGTVLSSSTNPSTAGQVLTLTATVSGATPTGTVTFKDGSTTVGNSTLANGVATLSYSAWSAGNHSVTATYNGDGNNAASTSAALTQAINAATTTLTLTSSAATASLGQNVTLTAKVVGGFIPSGAVTFYDGSTALGLASVSGGAATFSINSLGLGNHTLSAVYAGDASNQTSSSGSVSLTVNPRAGMTWQYGYDAMGRINTQVDPNGNATYTYYDSLGRAIQSQQPPKDGSTTPTITGYSYNLADGLTQVADPRNLATNYSPNGLGNVTSQSSPDSGNTQYTYDAKGNLLTKTDARSKTTTYTYDSLDRVLSISYPTGTAITFEYDGGANPTAAEKGELTKMTDESGSTSYSHDALGRLISKTTIIQGKTFATSYSWGDTGSAMDKLIAITYPSGSRVNYSYDAQGYLSAISVNPVNPNGAGVSGTSVNLLTNITYNAENKTTGWLWSDGKARTMAYDSYGRISAYSLGDPLGTGNAAGTLRTLNRDAAGRITGYTHTNNGTPQTQLDQGFAYDNLNRLLSASLNSSSTQYSYDETGNRTSKTIAGTTYSNTIEATSNKLTQTQDVNGVASILHDAVGNIVNDGTFGFTYSDRGRLASVSTAGGTVNYLYNGNNLRVYKSGPTAVVSSGAAYYLYDEAGQLLGEYDGAGNPVYETVYLGSMPVGVLKQTGSAATSDIAVSVYNLHADHIATPRVITQQDEQIVWRWDSAEAFGGSVPDQNPNNLGTFVYNQRFPGQVFDAETGLFDNWNRTYDARQGRYRQSDPIGLAGGINTFAYVGGRPLMVTDPTGLSPGEACPLWREKLGWCKPTELPRALCDKACSKLVDACKRAMGPQCILAGTPCTYPCDKMGQECRAQKKIKCNQDEPEPEPNDGRDEMKNFCPVQ